MATCGKEIHVGDIGTLFEVTLYDCELVVDLTGATTLEIIFLKPDGSKLIASASFKTDGTDGVITYAAISGDIDQAGSWKLQAHVVLPTGEWWSDTDKFKVYANL
jgi:hypothetical protein